MSIRDLHLVNSSKGIVKHSVNGFKHLLSYPCDTNDECSPYSALFSPGIYKIECWGASGGDSSYQGGAGSFTSGIIAFSAPIRMYFFLGAAGKPGINGSFNGGGTWYDSSSRSGGGSTDIRISPYFNFTGLMDRIMVAAGGGGAAAHGSLGEEAGAGGGLTGSTGGSTFNMNCPTFGSFSTPQIPAGQTHGGVSNTGNNVVTNGTFGNGGSVVTSSWAGTGGGGYYGGSTGNSINCVVSMGGGGSSFISGHEKCDAILSHSNPTEIIHSGQSIHYSGLSFTSTLMLRGNETITSPEGVEDVGHRGNGFVRITIMLSYDMVVTCKSSALGIISITCLLIFSLSTA